MGNGGSKRDNDEVVDELCNTNNVPSDLEMILRIVDRKFFSDLEDLSLVYSLNPIVNGIIHISSPTIYVEALCALNITKGHKFLNVGSGSGYLSTIVGCMLGVFGMNHGIELKQDLVKHSRRKIKEFVVKNPLFDMFDFCEPQFTVGNVHNIDSNKYRDFYDRIYCGANISENFYDFFVTLLAPCGIMVMPCSDSFLKICKDQDGHVTCSVIMGVRFKDMHIPFMESEPASLPDVRCPSLKSLCRSKIREFVRVRITGHIGHEYVPLRKFYMDSLDGFGHPVISDHFEFENMELIYTPPSLDSTNRYEEMGDTVPYTELMAKFINEYSLHKSLRDYLMYYRDLAFL